MSDEAVELPGLEALDVEAQRAVGAARSEAQMLGHATIGTEHLLLGILRNESTAATRALHASGVGTSAVRNKVREASPAGSGSGGGRGPEKATPRAARAITRSVRFSRQRQTNQVMPEDLCIAVLDVEGTAGQVLRSLGVDLDSLRDQLESTAPVPATGHIVTTREGVEPSCPACGCDLSAGLRHRRVPSIGAAGTVEVLVHGCGACGATIGTSHQG